MEALNFSRLISKSKIHVLAQISVAVSGLASSPSTDHYSRWRGGKKMFMLRLEGNVGEAMVTDDVGGI